MTTMFYLTVFIKSRFPWLELIEFKAITFNRSPPFSAYRNISGAIGVFLIIIRPL
jgi:hypothetical protein